MGALALAAAPAAVSEAAVALGIAGLGASSGAGWSLRDILLSAAVLALLLGGPLVAGLAFTPFAGIAARAVPPAALATAAAVVARYLAYDPYYAPSLRRISHGILPPGGSFSWRGLRPSPPSAAAPTHGRAFSWPEWRCSWPGRRWSLPPPGTDRATR
jgi:hypothetical protein